MKDKYLTIEEAAKIINDKYSPSAFYNAMMIHVKNGNFEAHYPKMYVKLDDGSFQPIELSTKPLFLESQIKAYKKRKDLGNRAVKVVLYNEQEEIPFNSIQLASSFLDVPYLHVYHKINTERAVKGYKVKKV